MTYTRAELIKHTVQNIKKISNANGSYFFSRQTMKFFGDTMSSFGVRSYEDKRYLYRKPTAYVNVFGTWQKAGRQHFNAWEWTGSSLISTSDETEQAIYEMVS